MNTLYRYHDGPDVLEVTFSGPVDREGVHRVNREMARQPVFRDDVRLLLDWRRCALPAGGLSYGELRELVDALEIRAHPRIALLVDGALAYGVGRMWTAVAERGVGPERRVFEDRELALAWVADADPAAPGG